MYFFTPIPWHTLPTLLCLVLSPALAFLPFGITICFDVFFAPIALLHHPIDILFLSTPYRHPSRPPQRPVHSTPGSRALPV
ncbi:hypothetical protein C8R44DRAFT_793990, partial [Mycena epipterygia]